MMSRPLDPVGGVLKFHHMQGAEAFDISVTKGLVAVAASHSQLHILATKSLTRKVHHPSTYGPIVP